MQLEFNFDNKTPEELKLEEMQKQIDELNESMGKVRRKLFAEMGEIKKLYMEMKNENELLKSILKENENEKEKTQWSYAQENYLFCVRKSEEATG